VYHLLSVVWSLYALVETVFWYFSGPQIANSRFLQTNRQFFW